MVTWILIIAVLLVVIIVAAKLIFSKKDKSDLEEILDAIETNKSKSLKGRLKAVDVLPNVIKLKETKGFNWLKLHQNINPTNNPKIQEKLTKLIRDEREYIIIDKFIYFTEEQPNSDILQVLEQIENVVIDYNKVLYKLGNR